MVMDHALLILLLTIKEHPEILEDLELLDFAVKTVSNSCRVNYLDLHCVYHDFNEGRYIVTGADDNKLF